MSSDDGCSWSDWIVLRDDAGTGDIGADGDKLNARLAAFLRGVAPLSQLNLRSRLLDRPSTSIARTTICQDMLGTITWKEKTAHRDRRTE